MREPRQGLREQESTARSSGGWKVQIKVPAESVPGENTLPGLQVAATSLCPRTEDTETRSLVSLLRTLIPL